MGAACRVCDGYCGGSCTVAVHVNVKLCRRCGQVYREAAGHDCQVGQVVELPSGPVVVTGLLPGAGNELVTVESDDPTSWWG